MKKVKMRYYLFLVLSISTTFAGFGQDRKPIQLGVTVQLFSKTLGENRTINIYFPENYSANDTAKYPVIYIPDGGLKEDFIHLAGLVRFNTQPWIDRFPKSIVVGVENSNRKRDFTFSVSNLDFLKKVGFKKEQMRSYGGSANYIKFLKEELQPFIAKEYRGSQRKTIIGESLAGLLLTEILVKDPNMFDDYIIVSPSLWWGDELLLQEANALKAGKLGNTTRVYIGAPQMKEDVRMYNEALSLSRALRKQSKLQVHFDYLPQELHSTVLHQAVYNAFKKFYPKTAYSK